MKGLPHARTFFSDHFLLLLLNGHWQCPVGLCPAGSDGAWASEGIVWWLLRWCLTVSQLPSMEPLVFTGVCSHLYGLAGVTESLSCRPGKWSGQLSSHSCVLRGKPRMSHSRHPVPFLIHGSWYGLLLALQQHCEVGQLLSSF